MGFGGKDYGLECRASGSEGAKGIGGRRNLPFSTAPRHVCSWCGEKKMVGRLDVALKGVDPVLTCTTSR